MKARKIGAWIVRILGIIIGLLIVTLVVVGFISVPQDEVLSPDEYGAGASSVQPSITGLHREFPALNEPEDNLTSPEKVELGRMLFFDPVLSSGNDMACASCHHPDKGFSDGLPQAIGSGDKSLKRNSLSLWNVGYAESLFWDGRESTLEEQALEPLTHADEMGVSDTRELEIELLGIPEYVVLFNAAFGGAEESVNVENVLKAIAAFERSLITTNSPFDRYAAGDLNALTPAQRRGLTLFRSAATRCFECHSTPTFATNTFRVTGAPEAPGLDHDPGRAGAADNGADGAFKVPSLRNVVLSAPYMHNGVFATLEEVIDFYAEGGGRAHGVENMDVFVQGFELNDQERADLVAFLYALTDESNLPEIPTTLPSGLTPVASQENPARDLALMYNVPSSGETATMGKPKTITVQAGETIQDAVDQARTGDTVLIPYGIYHERVVVDLNQITIHGIPNDDGDWPTLDGQFLFSDGIISSGNDFEVAYLRVINYRDNGILVEGVTNVYMHHIYAEDTGVYGLYPVQSTGVLIEHSVVVGANDAGIYAGQCENVIIRNNVVYENVLGIEVENSNNAEIYDNHAYNNTNGILIIVLPNLTSKISLNTKIYNNLAEDNNHANFAKEGTAASIMPPGAGIALVAADHVEVYGNTLRNNMTAGIGIFSLLVGYDPSEVDVGPTPEHILVHDNIYENNGYSPDKFISSMGIPGADILWDVSGWDVRFDEPEASVFPPAVPTSKWPNFIYKIYWHVLNFLIGLM